MFTHFSKRYFGWFTLFFALWYIGSLIMYSAYQIFPRQVLYFGMNLYFPLMILIFSFLYFRKSANDWVDRFFVAFGWIFLSFVLSALLIGPVYGMSWTTIIQWDVIKTNWVSVLAVLVAGIVAGRK